MSSTSAQMDDNSSDDLLTKYQRLAAKYSKMRAQIQVLKTAFTDEQHKSCQLKDSVNERDQSVRRLEQEMESLDFRNQQLAKRVAVLQDELDVSQRHANSASGKKSLLSRSGRQLSQQSASNHSTPDHRTNGDIIGGDSVLDVMNGELQSKITENERLHIQLNAIEMDYQSKMADIERQLDQSRGDSDLRHKSLIESLDEKQRLVDALREDKEALESRLRQCLTQLDASKAVSQSLECENKAIETRIKALEESSAGHQEIRDNLSRQLSICESKLSASEQSVEHWMLESQLLHLKLDRELKRSTPPVQSEPAVPQTTGLSSGTDGNNGFGGGTSSSTPSSGAGSQRSIEMSCNDFAGSSLQSPTVSEDKLSLASSTTGAAGDEDVPQVTAYLRNRISQLVDSLHGSDSKAVAYHTECQSLQQKLTISDRLRQQCAKEMANREREVRELREELATNVSNYEQQLSLMSEHLANMNDKLTAQTDEIDSLKHHNHYQRADSTGKGKKVKNK